MLLARDQLLLLKHFNLSNFEAAPGFDSPTIEAENELSGKKSERTGFGASCNKSLHHICPPSIQNSHEEVKSKSN